VTYGHTIPINGTNLFAANETFPTTSNGYTGYVAWDPTYLYFGMVGPDVASGRARRSGSSSISAARLARPRA
jgi:hypothetical protein